MDFGSELKIVDVDADFYRYCKIQKKKAWLGEQLEDIMRKHKKLDSRQEKTVAGLTRKLRDLEKIKRRIDLLTIAKSTARIIVK